MPSSLCSKGDEKSNLESPCKAAVRALEVIGTKTEAKGAVLFRPNRKSSVEVSAWYREDRKTCRDVTSAISLPLRKTGKFLGALCLLDSKNPGKLNGSFLSPELDYLISILKQQNDNVKVAKYFIAESKVMKELLEKVKKVAYSKVPVLLLGESGSGKTEIARLIHETGPLKDKPFVALHCNTIPETLFESELFGHTKGAFTGATRPQKGLVELANKGTLFLDEIGELPLAIQSKLLRFIESGSYYQVGGRVLKNVQVRIICATSKDLEKRLRDGRFCPEFFYRIAGVQLRIPSLRKRREEIPLLADYFLARTCLESELPRKVLTSDAKTFLKRTDFPGNVRELANLMESVAAFVEDEKITASHLKKFHRQGQAKEEENDLNLERAKRRLEKRLIREALDRHRTVDEAARALGISRKSLWRKKKLLEK